ncbi:MAG: hypothetical protein QXW88_01605 [Thermofilum sp.]
MKRAWEVTVYLLKNNVNAVARTLTQSSAGKVALAALLAVLAAPPAYSILSVAVHGPPPAALARSWIPAGLEKNTVIASTSAFLTVIVLMTAFRGPHEITASEEAEYELLLSLPLTMPEYVLGKLGYFAAQSLLASTALVVAGVALAPLVTGGSVAKALLFPLAYLLFLLHAETLFQLIVVVRAVSGRRVWAVSAAALAYLAAAAAHSVLTRSLSPLLTAPALLAAAPLVHCFTISETPAFVALELAALLLLDALLVACLYAVSTRLEPENVKPLSEVARSLLLGRPTRSRRMPGSHSAAIRRVVLELPLLSLRHAALVLGALAAAAGGGYAARLLLPGLDASTVTSFAVGVLVLELTVSTGNIALRDLSPLWLYRTSAQSMKPLAASLLAKSVVYYTESFAVVGVLLASLTGNPAHLLLPLAAMPASAASATVALWFLAHVAAHRRLVRFSSRGFYLLEDIVATLITGFSLVAAVFSVTSFNLLLEYASGTALFKLFPLISLAVGAILTLIGRDVLADTLASIDVAG